VKSLSIAMWAKVVLALALAASADAQKRGTLQAETHPTLAIKTCTTSGCTSTTKSIVVDGNWRWLEENAVNCFSGNLWDQTNCPSTAEGAKNCAEKCSLEGASYEETYGVVTKDDTLTIAFVTKNTPGTVEMTNVGSRNYLMDTDEKYFMFDMRNKEFTFTVDVSDLVCGLNGALYTVEMASDGSMANYPDNKAGANMGTGYCDAQCPHDMKFIWGEANTIDWVPSDTDPNAGFGYYGTCCVEMDIWEANSLSQQLTPHSCSTQDSTQTYQMRCSDEDSSPGKVNGRCGDNGGTAENRMTGVCDKNGCDFNPSRFGNYDFWGPGAEYTVDTTKPVTVVTQFLTTDGTDNGDLHEIKRFFIQENNLWEMPAASIPSATTGEMKSYSSITDEFCADKLKYFNDSFRDGELYDGFKDHGGMKSLGESMKRGHVLVMSLWDDHYVNMLWLDSTYPTDSTKKTDIRGPCAIDSGVPADVEKSNADAKVVFSDVRYGPIGTTFLQQNM